MKITITLLIVITSFALPLKAQDGAQLEQVFSNGFTYRNLGPFRVSAWVSDIAVPETPAKAHLYTFYVGSRNGGVWKTTNNGQPRSRREEGAVGNYRLLGDRHLITPNEPNGLTLIYYLKDQPKEKITFTITGAEGKTLRTIEGTNKAGINRVVFQLGGLGFQQGSDGEPRPGPASQLREIPPGEYDVTLQVGDRKLTKKGTRATLMRWGFAD